MEMAREMLMLAALMLTAHADYVQPPVNLSCVALQEGSSVSGTISCEWRDLGTQTKEFPTTYTLCVKEMSGQVSSSTTRTTRAQVSLGTYPNHMTLEIWVQAENNLGTAESEHLRKDSGWFVKTNPPSNVSLISEQSFPTSLLLRWTPPINKSYVRLKYRIRYAPVGEHTWIYVPEEDTSEDILSFRLQNLQPFTLYNFQVSCKNARPGHGYWSEWSDIGTNSTPEARPPRKPDVWIIISQGNNTKIREVQILCKKPLKPNGRIIRYDLKLTDYRGTNGSMQQEMVFINSSITDSRFYNRDITVLKRVLLPDSQTFRVSVSAVNSVGQSAAAFLGVPERARERPPVEDLRVWSHDGRLMVEWKPPRGSKWTEFVVEWVGGGQKNWQREKWITTRTNITGPVERCVFYTVSVYAMWDGWRSRAASVEAFLEEGAPNEAPLVRLNDVPGHTEAHLVWDHTPPEKL
ncbi:interleukin-6 receptor subunit beta-like isoform X1 [Halichoeres trimaculatus]|uniref:interleukin-6 receptor subunit beta-like isoform X1 n=1 Tax=Halichoeres trimaculatus TaxID=147232 RepID=UPI003D9DD83D